MDMTNLCFAMTALPLLLPPLLPTVPDPRTPSTTLLAGCHPGVGVVWSKDDALSKATTIN